MYRLKKKQEVENYNPIKKTSYFIQTSYIFFIEKPVLMDF